MDKLKNNTQPAENDGELLEKPDAQFCTLQAECMQNDKKMRDGLTEKQIDRMGKDSFPASDPPGTY